MNFYIRYKTTYFFLVIQRDWKAIRTIRKNNKKKKRIRWTEANPEIQAMVAADFQPI